MHTKIINALLVSGVLLLFSSCKKESASGAKEPAWLKQDLLAYYPLDGNVKDSSGNGFDGVPTALQPTANRKNEPNKAMSFLNGSMALNLNSTHFSKRFTISLWARLDSMRSTHPMILSAGFISLYYNSNKLFLDLRGLGNATSAFIDHSKWNNITIIKDSLLAKIYLNGTYLHTSSDAPNSTLYSGLGINVGKELSGTAPWHNFNGKLDDIRFYKRALTPEEVKYLYQN
jgi:hypothetical protein